MATNTCVWYPEPSGTWTPVCDCNPGYGPGQAPNDFASPAESGAKPGARLSTADLQLLLDRHNSMHGTSLTISERDPQPVTLPCVPLSPE